MPIHEVKGGYKWGSHGHTYPTREGAEKQAEAAHANGFHGDSSESFITIEPKEGEFLTLPMNDSVKDASDCAGILFISDEKILLLHRTDRDEWEGPSGHIEPDEDSKQAAIRETYEETGHTVKPEDIDYGKVEDNGFTLFICNTSDMFDPVLNHEHDAYGWYDTDDLPENVHPNIAKRFSRAKNDSSDSPKTELDIAKAIKSGELSSPQQYENVVLFDLRITGTGLSKRDNPDEYVLRPAENFLTQEFVERCNGLPVIFEHPGESILTTDEYRERAIGTIILPYIKEDEVRGIAKIFDIDAANLMMETHISTSPGVVFRDDKESFYIDDLDGERVLVEGVPSYVDHLAICKSGVWDKGETPNGVNRGESTMPEEKPKEEVKKDSEGSTVEELLGKIMERMDAQDKRLDAMSKESRKDGDGENMPTEQLDGAKGEAEKDGEEEHKLEEEAEKEGEKEHKAEEKMRDDEKRKKDGEFDAKARKDSEKEGKVDEKMDSLKKDNLLLKAKLASMEQKFSHFTRELTPEERDQLGSAQRRADSVFQMLGENAPAPLAGERPISYRKRLASKIQKHSDKFKEVKLDSIDGTVYDEVERNIYEDAKSAASKVVNAGSGKLIAIKELDSTGTRTITRYVGDSRAGLAPFSARGVTVRINRDLISKGK